RHALYDQRRKILQLLYRLQSRSFAAPRLVRRQDSVRLQIDFQRTLTLDHDGDCSLLGMSADGTVYVEEIYGDGWLAQHAFAADGTRVASIDEDEGRRDDLRPLALPPDILRPQPGWH